MTALNGTSVNNNPAKLPSLPGQSAIVGARCIGHIFDDVLSSAALMNETDVLIGVHGEPLSAHQTGIHGSLAAVQKAPTRKVIQEPRAGSGTAAWPGALAGQHPRSLDFQHSQLDLNPPSLDWVVSF